MRSHLEGGQSVAFVPLISDPDVHLLCLGHTRWEGRVPGCLERKPDTTVHGRISEKGLEAVGIVGGKYVHAFFVVAWTGLAFLGTVWVLERRHVEDFAGRTGRPKADGCDADALHGCPFQAEPRLAPKNAPLPSLAKATLPSVFGWCCSAHLVMSMSGEQKFSDRG